MKGVVANGRGKRIEKNQLCRAESIKGRIIAENFIGAATSARKSTEELDKISAAGKITDD